MAIKFIRKHGRIIPVQIKQVGIAAAGSIAIGTAAQKSRGKAMEKIRGKGKKGTGSAVSTFVLDSAITGTGITIAAKKSKHFREGLFTLLKKRY